MNAAAKVRVSKIHVQRFTSMYKLHRLLPLVVLTLVAGCKDQTSATDFDQPETAVVPDNLPGRIDAAINYTREMRLMNTRDQAAWQIVHGLEAFGRDLKIETDGKEVSALDYIFQGNPLRGWNLRPGDHGVFVLLEAGSKTGEGHPDQWLGYLSQCGVQLDDPLIVGGKTYHVRDVLTQAQWDIYDGMEASWTLMAAVTFLPLDEKWKAKDGSEWSIERIVKMETAAPREPAVATTATACMRWRWRSSATCARQARSPTN